MIVIVIRIIIIIIIIIIVIIRRALDGVVLGGPAECGLDKASLDAYVRACGLDIDVGVGSLSLALNRLPGVTTISSCSSVHEGAHEEEAVVAFVCQDAPVAFAIADCVGPAHFKESREDAVQLKAGKPRQFRSYVVRSAAAGPDGRPDARKRVLDLMACAKRLSALEPAELAGLAAAPEEAAAAAPAAAATPAATAKRRRRQAAAAGLAPCGELWPRLPAMRAAYAETAAKHVALAPLFEADALAAARDELVAGLKGLQPVETELICVFARPLDLAGADGAAMPRVAELVASLYSEEVRRLLQEP